MKLTSSAGNHDKALEDPQARADLLQKYPSVTFLNHECANIQLKKADGPRTRFKVFGSPYSPANGPWAFGYEPAKANNLWAESIPMDTDIIITHTPPKNHCDKSQAQEAVGCEMLRQTLWRVRPLLSICGHVHEGRGAERVLWELESPMPHHRELQIGIWQDPGANNKKQSLIDLSSKSSVPLNNKIMSTMQDAAIKDLKSPTMETSSTWKFQDSLERESVVDNMQESSQPPSCHEGVDSPSGTDYLEALWTRRTRRETCIINAAIMASSWPYTERNKSKYNKAIVVDVDLPMGQYDTESSFEMA